MAQPEPADLGGAEPQGYAKALEQVMGRLRAGLVRRGPSQDMTGWANPHNGLLRTILVPEKVRLVSGVIACCVTCKHRLLPGLSFPGYCRARADLLPAYGENHPLRLLPDDVGRDCQDFMVWT